LSPRRGEALDIACGAGAHIFHVSRSFPGFRWTGVDFMGDALFPIGQQRLAAEGIQASLIVADLFQLDAALGSRRFDLVISTNTLSWLPNHERALEQALNATREGGWLVISSLFSTANIDTEYTVHDRTTTEETPAYHISVYSLPRIREFCERHGGVEFRSEPFDIGLDLEPPDSGGLGTYTRSLANGRRLQFTGPVFLPWYFIAVRKES